MHWLATILQLILSVTMTAIRSWVRRDLSKQPFNQKLPEGYELDWLATRDRLYEPSDRTDHTSKPAIPLSSLYKAMRSTQRMPYALSKFLHERVLWTRRRPRAWYGTDADSFEWFIVGSCISGTMSGTTDQDTTGPSASSADHKSCKRHGQRNNTTEYCRSGSWSLTTTGPFDWMEKSGRGGGILACLCD
jgi:hypothetical protein